MVSSAVYCNEKICPVALLGIVDENTKKIKSIHIESVTEKCKKKISKFFFKNRETLNVEFKNLRLNKEYLDVLVYTKKQIGLAMGSELEGEGKDTESEIENDYLGLIADGDNSIDIVITIDDKIKYDKLFFKAKDGIIVDYTQIDKRRVVLTYKPNLLLDPPIKKEEIQIKLLDKYNKEIQNKEIPDLSRTILLVRPPVILIHGLWVSSEVDIPTKVTLQDYFYNKRVCCKSFNKWFFTTSYYWATLEEGCKDDTIKFSDKCLEINAEEREKPDQIDLAFSFDWEDNNADNMVDATYDFKHYVEGVLDEKFKQQNIKPGKYDIIASSAGGIIPRYYISSYSMLGYNKVRKLITFGTPHLGEPNFRYIWEFCPSVLAEEKVKYCHAYVKAAEGVKKLARKAGGVFEETDFFEVGPFVRHILPLSSFMNRLNSNPSYDNRIEYVFIAGTKGPLSVIRKDPVVSKIWPKKAWSWEGTTTRQLPWLALFIGNNILDLDLDVEIPEEGKIIFRNLFYMLSEEGYSDGIVHYNSALAIEVDKGNQKISEGKEIIKGKRYEFPTNHFALLAPNRLPLILGQLYNKEYKIIAKGSPINIHVYDSKGNHIGIGKDNELESGIPGAFFVKGEEEQLIYLPPDQEYTYKIEGTGKGDFSLAFNEEKDGKYRTMSYSGVNVTENTKADFKPSKNIIKSTLTIDEDGDGNIDNEFYPDSTFEGEIKKQEEIAEGTQKELYTLQKDSTKRGSYY